MKKFCLCLVLAFLFSLNAQAQSFNAKANRDVVPEGETFLLTFELEGANAKSNPDFSALDKDFIVYSISNAYQTNIINGDVKKSQQWNLVMMPKKSGNLTIPAVSLDDLTSSPLTIKVAKSGENISPQDAQQNQPRFKISGVVDNKNPYVQQQINYTLTLRDTGGLQGEEPQFIGDNGSDWIIKNLGAPEISTQIINGKNIREIVFKYALFPQKSGLLEIPAVRFNGYYLTREKRNDPFGRLFNDDMFIAGFGMADVFATRNPVVLTTEAMKVNVKPAAPENNGNWWLPASKVKLYAEFNPANQEYRTGEAINRTIYLTANGVIDTQLPEINFGKAENVKQYPEKPQSVTKVQKGQVVSVEKISNVYIPLKSGKITLPEITVNWFNVNTGKMETASLPPVTLNVMEGASVPETQPAAVTEISETGGAHTVFPPQEQTDVSATEQLNSKEIYLLLLIAFILGIAFCWFLMRGFSSKNSEKHIRNYKKYIIAKAQEKDLRALRDGIIEWAKKHFHNDNISTLKDVEDAVQNPKFECELEKLTESLYSKGSIDWNEKSFIKIFEKIYAQKPRSKDDGEILPKLYK